MKTIILSIVAMTLVAGPGQAAARKPGPIKSAPSKSGPPSPVAPLEFAYEDHGVYELVAAPGRISDITLEAGEVLVDSNPIAAGDTARWVIGDTVSGEEGTRRVHVLVKPTSGELSTNLVINTTRRTYFLQLRASNHAYLTQVSWRYAPAPTPTPAPAPIAARSDAAMQHDARPVAALNFGYRISGRARFRPERVYDDGARTYLVFGPSIAMSDLPPLYRLSLDRRASELINYRVEGRTLVIDQLVDTIELRLGIKKGAQRVRIERRSEAGQ